MSYCHELDSYTRNEVKVVLFHEERAKTCKRC